MSRKRNYLLAQERLLLLQEGETESESEQVDLHDAEAERDFNVMMGQDPDEGDEGPPMI